MSHLLGKTLCAGKNTGLCAPISDDLSFLLTVGGILVFAGLWFYFKYKEKQNNK